MEYLKTTGQNTVETKLMTEKGLEIRVINERDRADIVSWWKDWGFSIIPEALLPKRGYIVLNEKEKIAATWLYVEEDIGICWMAWTVSNKKVDQDTKQKGLEGLIDRVKIESKFINKDVIFTTTGNSSVRNRLEANKFFKGDINTDHYIYFGDI